MQQADVPGAPQVFRAPSMGTHSARSGPDCIGGFHEDDRRIGCESHRSPSCCSRRLRDRRRRCEVGRAVADLADQPSSRSRVPPRVSPGVPVERRRGPSGRTYSATRRALHPERVRRSRSCYRGRGVRSRALPARGRPRGRRPSPLRHRADGSSRGAGVRLLLRRAPNALPLRQRPRPGVGRGDNLLLPHAAEPGAPGGRASCGRRLRRMDAVRGRRHRRARDVRRSHDRGAHRREILGSLRWESHGALAQCGMAYCAELLGAEAAEEKGRATWRRSARRSPSGREPVVRTACAR